MAKHSKNDVLPNCVVKLTARPNPSFEATSNSGTPHAGKAGFAHSALPAWGVPLSAAPQFER